MLRKAALFAVVTVLFIPPAAARDLLVFAAASTADVLQAALDAYRRTSADRVRVSYASSGALARQIAAGAPADLYLSANRQWVAWLTGKGIVAKDRSRPLFGNRLVLIGPKTGTLNVSIAPGFPLAEALGTGRLAIANPDHAPAGQYARDALTSLGVWKSVESRTARAQNVRAALALVERGEAPAGIVYRTDAAASSHVRIADTFPASSHRPIAYVLAQVAPSENGAAGSLYDWLVSPAPREIYKRFGFEVSSP